MFRVRDFTNLFISPKNIVLGLVLLFGLPQLAAKADEQAVSPPGASSKSASSVELDTTIDAVNTMVNGISAQLLETSGVRQKTIIQVLDDANAMLVHTVSLFGSNSSARKNLYELIEVDIRLYISASYSTSGDYVGASEQIQTAKVLYNQLCDAGRSRSRPCTLSGIRIKITQTEQLLLQRPETSVALQNSSVMIAKALLALSDLIAVEEKRRPVNQNVLNELQLLRAKAQVIAVRTFMRHAMILSGQNKMKKAAASQDLATKCVESFAASAAKNDDISEAIGSCTNLQALALHILARQPELALTKARKARSILADLSKRRVENIPLTLEHIYTRLYLGFMLHKTNSMKGGKDRDHFMAALREFEQLISANPDNYMLRSRYIQLSANLIDGSWFRGVDSAGAFYKLLVEVLENRADYLTGRLNLLREMTDKAAQREAAILRGELAKTLEKLMSRYYRGERVNAIIERFAKVSSLLPLPTGRSTTSEQGDLASARDLQGGVALFSDAYMASTLEVYYWVAQAYRQAEKEKQAMQAFLILEEHSRSMKVPTRVKRRDSGIDRGVFRYFYAFAIRSLGAFDLENTQKRETELVLTEDQSTIDAEQEIDLEHLLGQAKQRIEKAANRDSKNQEFRYAQAQITFKHGQFMENRMLLDGAGESYRRAADLGSKKAASKLSSWYRTASGPTHQIDVVRAERYSSISRNSSVMEYTLYGKSSILPGAKAFTIYLLPGRRGKRHIAAEKSRLRRYYGVANIDRKTESWLGDLYDQAIQRAGDASRMTINDLEEAKKSLEREREEQAPFEGSGIEEELMASRNELENGDHAKALAKLQTANILSSPHLGILKLRQLEDLGIAALQFLNIAEIIDRSTGSNSVSRRAKKASHRALRRVMEDTGYQQADCHNCRSRTYVYERLSKRAYKMLKHSMKDGKRTSYELNVDYMEKYREITTLLQQRAIEATIAYSRIAPGIPALELLQLRYAYQGVYHRTGWTYGDPIQQAKYLQKAMNAYNNSQSVVSQLRQRRPLSQSYQAVDMLLGVNVVNVHVSHGEHKVALRLIRTIVEEMQALMRSRAEGTSSVEFLSEAARVHVKAGDIEWQDAKQRIDEYNRIIRVRKTLVFLKKTKANLELIDLYKALLASKKAKIEGLYNNAVGNYEEASKLYQEIIAAKPDIHLEDDINKNIRGIVDLKKWYAENLFDREKDEERYKEVQVYLDEQVKHWQDKVENTGNGPEARQFKWYYARTLALRADLEREFPPDILRIIHDSYDPKGKKSLLEYKVPQKSYAAALKSFESIKHMSDIIKADYAMFLNNLGFFYLMNNKDAKAIKVLKKAYGFWKVLPYSIWGTLKVSDLNIPANYAHSLLVARNSGQAQQIYRKYEGRHMRVWAPGRTWNDLIISDLDDLNKKRKNELQVGDIVRELQLASERTVGR